MIIRKYTEKDISEMVHIWNEVVEDGEAFPQEEFLDDKTGAEFFASQTYCGVADNDGEIVGLYILLFLGCFFHFFLGLRSFLRSLLIVLSHSEHLLEKI